MISVAFCIEEYASDAESTATGVFANRCMTVKKNSAMETLFVECVEGNPYSK